jgi:hypothetical protein
MMFPTSTLLVDLGLFVILARRCPRSPPSVDYRGMSAPGVPRRPVGANKRGLEWDYGRGIWVPSGRAGKPSLIFFCGCTWLSPNEDRLGKGLDSY